MIIKDKKTATDKAWSQLYNRLEQDGLLNEAPKTGYWQPRHIAVWSMSLAAVLIIGLLLVHQFIAAPAKDLIVVNTSPETMPNAFLAKLLDDGSIVYIADSATFSYPSHFDGDRREVTLAGEAFFDVTSNSGQPFFVETRYAYIEVMGTMFGIQSFAEENFKVTVSSGEVKVRLKNNEHAVYVKSGEYVILEKEELRKGHDEQAMQFEPYSGKIYFKDMPLADIIAIVNKQNGRQILALAQGLGDYVLTATFIKDEPAIIADLICKTLNLKFSYRDDVIIIHE